MKGREIVAAIACTFRHWNDEEDEGQSMVEYALVIVLIAVVSMAVLKTVGEDVSGVFTKIDAALTTR